MKLGRSKPTHIDSRVVRSASARTTPGMPACTARYSRLQRRYQLRQPGRDRGSDHNPVCASNRTARRSGSARSNAAGRSCNGRPVAGRRSSIQRNGRPHRPLSCTLHDTQPKHRNRQLYSPARKHQAPPLRSLHQPPQLHQRSAVQATQPSVQVQGTDLFTATQQGAPVTGGKWVVLGGSSNGSIDAQGNYLAPAVVPSPSTISVGFILGTSVTFATVDILDIAPTIVSTSPAQLTRLVTPIIVTGTWIYLRIRPLDGPDIR